MLASFHLLKLANILIWKWLKWRVILKIWQNKCILNKEVEWFESSETDVVINVGLTTPSFGYQIGVTK